MTYGSKLGLLAWLAILASWTLFALCFPFFYNILGEHVAATAAFPVIVTASMGGLRWGFLAGITALIANQLLLLVYGGVAQTLLLTTLPGAVAGVLTGSVVGHLHDLRKKLAFYAYHDVLTGLYNRAAFMRHLTRTLERTPKQDGACLLFIDLDGFKAVNDQYGHAVGDALLKEVAARLRQNLGQGDVAGRLGGDEFTVLLTATSLSRALNTTRTLLEVLEAPAEVQGKSLRVGASIGVAAYPHHAGDAETLIKCADNAMYAAKRGGKRGCRVFGDVAVPAPLAQLN